MAYRLPDNTLIIEPSQSRSFFLGDVEHNEMNLPRWKEQNILADYGIVWEDTVIGDPVFYDLDIEKRRARGRCRMHYEDYLNFHSDIEKDVITSTYATGTAAQRTKISAFWTWRRTVIDELIAKLEAITAATSQAELEAITWDPTTFDASKPANGIKYLIT